MATTPVSSFPVGSVTHVVLFEFTESCDEETCEAYMAEIRDFKKTMSNLVLDVSAGKTFTTERADGFTHCISVVLRDKDSLPLYSQHELHQDFLKRSAPHRKRVCAMDWVN